MTTEGAAVPGWADVTDSQEGMPQARKKRRNYNTLNKYTKNKPTKEYIFGELEITSPGTIEKIAWLLVVLISLASWPQVHKSPAKEDERMIICVRPTIIEAL